MSPRGRPLRFLALVVLGWTGARAGFLWFAPDEMADAPAPRRLMHRGEDAKAVSPKATAVAVTVVARSEAPPSLRPHLIRAHAPHAAPSELPRIAGDRHVIEEPAAPAPLSPWLPTNPQARYDRWSGSLWLTARGSEGLGAAPGTGQLGGGQAGARIAFVIDPAHRITLAGRLVTPLRGQGREAALALEWQPTRAPVRLMVEHRVALDRGRGGPGAGMIGGLDTRLPGDFQLEAYAQAGGIARRRFEPYADGALRMTHRATPALRIGAGAWGAAQREAARLDIGPTLTADLPLAGRTVRVLLDWRQRVAGDARPGSGAALTLAADF